MNQILNLTYDADNETFTLSGAMDGEPVTITGPAGEVMQVLARSEREQIPGAKELVNDVLSGDKGERARCYYCAVLTFAEQHEVFKNILSLPMPPERDLKAERAIRENYLVAIKALTHALDVIAAWSAVNPRAPEREQAIREVDRFLWQYAQIAMFVEPEILEVSARTEEARI